MSGLATAGLCIAIVIVGAGGVYLATRAMRPPVTAVVQAPSAAVAGIQTLGQLASHGIDAYLASRANKSE